jgi:hypothetical protein
MTLGGLRNDSAGLASWLNQEIDLHNRPKIDDLPRPRLRGHGRGTIYLGRRHAVPIPLDSRVGSPPHRCQDKCAMS